MPSTGTPLSSIFDTFTALVNDYKLLALFEASEESFTTKLRGWLDLAILEFKKCDQSLEYDDEALEFDVELTKKNQSILARLMAKYWLQGEVNDANQMELHVQDSDFKTYSEAQNLDSKTTRLANLTEELSQLLVDYELDTNPWSDWYSGTFYTP